MNYNTEYNAIIQDLQANKITKQEAVQQVTTLQNYLNKLT